MIGAAGVGEWDYFVRRPDRPHIIRTAIGADHRMLIPASILGGAAFTVAAAI